MRTCNRSFSAVVAGLTFIVGLAQFGAPTPSFAASITYTDPVCSQFFTLPGAAPGDVLLRCVKMNCAIVPVGTGYIVPLGTTVTLQATCVNPAAQSYAWNLGLLSPQGCPPPQAVAGDPSKVTLSSSSSRTCFYEVVTGDTPQPPSPNQGIARYGIAWISPPPSGCTASVNPTSLPSTGGTVNLNGACTTGPVTAWSWTQNNSLIAIVQNPTITLPPNTTSSPITYTFAMTACNDNSCTTPIAASQGPVTVNGAAVPSGCTITPSPSNASLPSTGGNIQVAVSCTAGGPFTQFNWRRITPANVTTNLPTNAATQNDTLPSNPSASPVNYTYDVQVCNSAGCASRIAQVFSVAGTVSTGGPLCAGLNVLEMDLPWPPSADTIHTQDQGALSADGVFVGRIVVPANATSASGDGRIQWAEYVDGPGFRTVTLSTQKCDFRTAPSQYLTDPTGSVAPLKWSGGTSGDLTYVVAPEAGTSAAPQLQPGAVYYFNLRNTDFAGNATCGTQNTCNVVIHHTTPR